MTIQEAVAKKITDCAPAVMDAVVEKLSEVEINKRIDILAKAIKQQEILEKGLKKINFPDIKQFDATGVEVKFMSEGRAKEIKSAKEALDKIENSINACLTTNTYDDYQKLESQLGGNKNQGEAGNKPAEK